MYVPTFICYKLVILQDPLLSVTSGSQQQSQCSLHPTVLPGLPVTEVSFRSGDDYVSSRDTTPSLGDLDQLMEVDSGQQQPTTTSKAKGKTSQAHKVRTYQWMQIWSVKQQFALRVLVSMSCYCLCAY